MQGDYTRSGERVSGRYFFHIEKCKKKITLLKNPIKVTNVYKVRK